MKYLWEPLLFEKSRFKNLNLKGLLSEKLFLREARKT